MSRTSRSIIVIRSMSNNAAIETIESLGEAEDRLQALLDENRFGSALGAAKSIIKKSIRRTNKLSLGSLFTPGETFMLDAVAASLGKRTSTVITSIMNELDEEGFLAQYRWNRKHAKRA